MRKRQQVNAASELRRELGYLTEIEVAGLCGVGLPTWRNRQTAGATPPHYKLGREKLYRRDEVEAWLRRRRVDRAA